MSHIDYFGMKLIKIVKRRNSLGFSPLRENWKTIHLFNKLSCTNESSCNRKKKKNLNFCKNYVSFRVISLKTTISRIEERFKPLENTWFLTHIPFQGEVSNVLSRGFQTNINGAVWSNMHYLTIITVFVIPSKTSTPKDFLAFSKHVSIKVAKTYRVHSSEWFLIFYRLWI